MSQDAIVIEIKIRRPRLLCWLPQFS